MVSRAVDLATDRFVFTRASLTETSPVARRYTGFHTPAFRSGTKDALNWEGFFFSPLYPRNFQLIQSNQLSASSTPSTSCINCSGVTLTANAFGEPGVIHRVTLNSCAAYMPTTSSLPAILWPLSQISAR